MIFTRCPKSWIRDEAAAEARWVDEALWFLQWRALPDPGGMLDQDQRWLVAVEIVEGERVLALRVGGLIDGEDGRPKR